MRLGVFGCGWVRLGAVGCGWVRLGSSSCCCRFRLGLTVKQRLVFSLGLTVERRLKSMVGHGSCRFDRFFKE